uniref:Uncharacterized protein n=1 Tax=Rhizophora mucronata TaxID=61149 RepID=A0A2P2KV00_RHIMU
MLIHLHVIFWFWQKEHLLEAQDQAEVDRVKINVEECRKMLQSLGYVDFTFEDFFTVILSDAFMIDIIFGTFHALSIL